MSRNRELSQFPEFLTVNDTYGSVGIGTSLTVTGLGTFATDLYVGGTLYAPSLNITGGATLGDDLTTRNISASGIVTVTGTTDLNGDLDVDGHAEFDNVRISGITTFESNIYLGNSDKVIMGGGDSFQLYHDGSNSYIVDSGAGDLYLRGTGAIRFQNSSGTENYAIFNDSGTTELYYDNSKKLETTTGGISVTGNIVASGNVTVGGTLIYEDVTNVDSVGIATARAGLRITGGGLDVVGVATFNNGVNTLDVIGHTELDQLRVSGVSTFTGSIDANGDLDVDGHTELDNLNVSGVSTFVGIVTSQSNVFVGNNLSVAGNARVVGVLTVGSSSITLDGSTNTINVGAGVTVHTTTVAVNQLEVAGLSTFTGIGTFKNDLYVGGTLYTPSLVVEGGATLGEDITTRNLSASGILTTFDLNVDGHTELDNTNISGVATVTSLNVQSDFDVYDTLATFHNNLYIAGNLSIGGTTTVIQAQDLQVFDKDIILGVTTDGSGNDISNDTTANHGGIAIASTEGSPLVDLYLVGLETSPVTYKKLMWFREGSFSGLGTDAWLTNYAVGIGSTQVPNGVRLAAGGVQVTDNTIGINGAEVLSSTTLGSGVVNSSLTSLGTLGQVNVSGVATFAGSIDANGDLDVDGHAEFDNVNVSGVLTATSFVGDGSQLTGVSGFATALSNDQTSPLNKIFKTPKALYIPANTQADVNVSVYEGSLAFMRESVIVVGSGATFHVSAGTTVRTNAIDLFETTPNNLTVDNLTVSQNTYVTGVVTATSFVGDGSGITGVAGTGGLSNIVEDTTPQLGGNLDLNNNNVGGTGNVNITGIITATSFVGDGSNITGITTSQISGYGGGLGGSVGVDFQEFTSNGTWTKPDGVTWVEVEVIGGGGGGGSGTRNTSSDRCGGTGGWGSPIIRRVFAASSLGATESITIAAGGTGGASVTTDSTLGNDGTDGGTSSFGSHITSGFGPRGKGANGTSTVRPPYFPSSPKVLDTSLLGPNAYGLIPGAPGVSIASNSYSEDTLNAVPGNSGWCGGGGSSGGITASTFKNGGAGGFHYSRTDLTSALGGQTEGANGGDAGTGDLGGAGAGAGSRAGNAGNGGNGSIGGGGGGGGTSLNGVGDSGAGGNGGNGRVRIWAW